ncbi:MAG: WsbH [Candidatus Moranbacteria bacterium GW2011_GWE1_49_15]|nr:MAG: WsbH [Candidatus Moranbacteria bacterium GW2011_GWE2_47_10]KKW06556.1 MAG: WsbH [Candidatus Moranbacteria bacterium GW2011_GWE1_49_15]
MNILIVTHYLDNFAGSELFTKELAERLAKKSHKIFVYAPFLGKVSDSMKNKGIDIVSDLKNISLEKIDVIHAQHNVTAILVRSVFPNTPMVFMSHGVVPELEQSPSIDIGISRYIAVSEEVKENLLKSNISEDKIDIVRNFVDTEKFCCRNKINKKPKKVLVISNHYTDEVRSNIEKACEELKIFVEHVGLPNNPTDDVAGAINRSDIVFTLGRGALEAMSCERNVIVYDVHGADGFINEENFFDYRKKNFSGRTNSINFSKSELKEEIGKYDPNLGLKLRNVVRKENEIEFIVSRLEKIYENALNGGVHDSKLQKDELYRELLFLEKRMISFDLQARVNNRKIKELKNALKIKNEEIDLKNREIELRRRNIESIKEDIYSKDREIEFIKSSKFWKIRNGYAKLKNRMLKK